jgi:mono/diheme cytochrome c family protein
VTSRSSVVTTAVRAAVPIASAPQSSTGVSAAGETTFQQKCAACHSTEPFDHKRVGPGLGHVLSDPAHPNLTNGRTATEQNVSRLLVDGYNGMQNRSANDLSDEDIAALTAYLASLR